MLIKNKEIIDNATYKSSKSVVSRPCILYGLDHKKNKKNKNGIQPFRSFLSTIDTATTN